LQDYLIIALLTVNLFCVLLLAAKVSSRQKSANQQDLHQKIIENQAKMMREIHEIKGNIRHNQLLIQREFEKWKAELKALEASVQPTSHSRSNDNGQNLYLNDRYQEIFELLDQGLSVDEIAKRLGKGSGEVSFILQLADQTRT